MLIKIESPRVDTKQQPVRPASPNFQRGREFGRLVQRITPTIIRGGAR
ncbi:hypothetical protein ACX80I_01015 [Arthrobacter sp. MDT3-44]